MKFLKWACDFQEIQNQDCTFTQVCKMLDVKKEHIANIAMASESSYDMLCSSYDCDSNDFSLDTNRSIA